LAFVHPAIFAKAVAFTSTAGAVGFSLDIFSPI
jgi:hypothetical protein